MGIPRHSSSRDAMLLLYGDLVLINNAIIMAKSNSAFMKPMQVSDDLAEARLCAAIHCHNVTPRSRSYGLRASEYSRDPPRRDRE